MIHKKFDYPLIVGDSHAYCCTEVFGMATATFEDRVESILHVTRNDLVAAEYLMVNSKHDFFQAVKRQDGNIQLSIAPQISSYLRENSEKFSCVLLSLNGNTHNASFMIERDRLFDFWDPKIPELQTNRQIVPRVAVYNLFAQRLHLWVAKAALLKKILPASNFYIIPAPPQIPSIEHISKNPEIFDFTKQKLQPAVFRKKIHSVFLEAQKRMADAVGGTMLLSTPSLIDEDGFLKEEYWHGCTHASPAYYKKLLSEYAGN
jgi:hypothetical protein